MKTISPDIITPAINRCFMEYDPRWEENYNGKDAVHSFKYYAERTAGLKLDFQPETKDGKYGYRLDGVEIVDEKKFMLFQIKYA